MFFSHRKLFEKVFLGAHNVRVQPFKMWTAKRFSAEDSSVILSAQIQVKQEAENENGYHSAPVPLFSPILDPQNEKVLPASLGVFLPQFIFPCIDLTDTSRNESSW